LRDQLKAGLSATAHQPDNERLSAAEVAEKIKSLKAVSISIRKGATFSS
jgi:hypothetical protein